MRYLRHQARWQELRRSEWLVIPWVADARKIPTAVPDSVGQAYREPIATIREIGFNRFFDADWMSVSWRHCLRPFHRILSKHHGGR